MTEFTDWTSARNADAYPADQVVYVIRVVDAFGSSVGIQRARKVDEAGIINIGSGFASSRLWKLKAALELTSPNEWNQSTHHQLMLWWLHCDFDSLTGFAGRNLEVCWKVVAGKQEARKLESELLWAYKIEYADIPIGNLKTW